MDCVVRLLELRGGRLIDSAVHGHRQAQFVWGTVRGQDLVAVYGDFASKRAANCENVDHALPAVQLTLNNVTAAVGRADSIRTSTSPLVVLVLTSAGSSRINDSQMDIVRILSQRPQTLSVELWHVDELRRCPFDSAMVHPHTIVQAADVPALLRTLGVAELRHLPKIYMTDPPLKWMGGRVGDVVRIDDFDPFLGPTVVFRLVIDI